MYSLTCSGGPDVWAPGHGEDHLHPRGWGAVSCRPHHPQPGSMTGRGSWGHPPAQTVGHLSGDTDRLKLGQDISPRVGPGLAEPVSEQGWAGGSWSPALVRCLWRETPLVSLWYKENILDSIHKEILFWSSVVGKNSWHLMRQISVHYTLLQTMSPVHWQPHSPGLVHASWPLNISAWISTEYPIPDGDGVWIALPLGI